MKNVLGKIKLYLTDWKNILTHSLVGIGIVILGFFSPIHPHARITLVGSVICLNTIRMKYF
ncbi:MAG: hypothetical protein AMQ74_01939 [Candidatus Methanofastidiosum methylothiophilum]|uniref:Uncharacterized protein n=1 Tax=Candidatus Methanofastidiosum methylothiophilum TaxID=1705564 RepID=A0A150IJC5_9EURY|nr:MAG: hypothetical protein AMQ74_01939 [Candidatus Methanofastidiosum methylthiophilus]NMC77655.1 hypothetical protein [Candidatus Methanofastidiosa archaeon]